MTSINNSSRKSRRGSVRRIVSAVRQSLSKPVGRKTSQSGIATRQHLIRRHLSEEEFDQKNLIEETVAPQESKKHAPRMQRIAQSFRQSLSKSLSKKSRPEIAARQHFIRQHLNEDDATDECTLHENNDCDEKEPVIVKEVSRKSKVNETSKQVPEEETRLALEAYMHNGFPSKKELIKLVERDPHSNVTIDAIESLPWMNGDYMVNGAMMVY